MSSLPARMVRHVADLARHIHRDTFARNGVYIMAVQVVGAGLGFVYWLIAARVFDAEALGLAASLVSAMTIASVVANLGINTALIQVLPKREHGDEWSATVNASLVAGTLSSVAAGFIALPLLPLLSDSFDVVIDDLAYLAAFVGGVVFTTLANFLDYTWVAERAAERTLARNVVFSVLKIPLLVLPPLVVLGTLGIFLSWVVATAATVVIAFLFLPRLGRGYRATWRGVTPELRRLKSYLAGHQTINIGNFAPWWLLPIFVTAQVSVESTAYFFATWRAVSVVYMICPAVATSLFAEGSHSRDEFNERVRQSARIIAKLLLPAVAVFILIGYPLLSAFGPEYAQQGYGVLILFSIAAIPDGVIAVYLSILRVNERLRFAALFQLCISAVTLVSAWLLLGAVGIIGAGVAWLLSRFVACGVIWFDHKRSRSLGAQSPDSTVSGEGAVAAAR